MPDVFEGLESLGGYPLLLVWCALCGILIPVPEDVPQAFAGAQIASGQMSWAPAFAVSFVGVLLRDSIFFGVGHYLGERAFSHPRVKTLLGEERLQAARQRVRDRGPMAVFMGRFTVGFRTATFLVAGAMGVRPRDFFAWDSIALLVSVPLVLGLGYAFGEPVAAGFSWVAERARFVVPAVVVAALVIWAVRSRFRNVSHEG